MESKSVSPAVAVIVVLIVIVVVLAVGWAIFFRPKKGVEGPKPGEMSSAMPKMMEESGAAATPGVAPEGTPAEKTGEAAPAEKTGEAAPVEKTGEAAPVEKTGEAAPVEKTGG